MADIKHVVETFVFSDPGLRACWAMLARGVSAGWMNAEDVQTLIAQLKSSSDYGSEELLFEHIGDDLKVRFLSDSATCKPDAFTAALEKLLQSL